MTLTGFLTLLTVVFVAVWLLLAVDALLDDRRRRRDMQVSPETVERLTRGDDR